MGLIQRGNSIWMQYCGCFAIHISYVMDWDLLLFIFLILFLLCFCKYNI